MHRDRACILNVNDNPAALYLTTLTLQRTGYEVLEARSGIEALRAAEQAPALVLLDVRLLDLSGHHPGAGGRGGWLSRPALRGARAAGLDQRVAARAAAAGGQQ